MCIYCVSDIHGQFDLFLEGLSKIEFNKNKDTLYILGDVCNGGQQSLKLYSYILNNKACVKLLLGNHDLYFLSIVRVFKVVVTFPKVLRALKNYLENYVSGFDKAKKLKSKDELIKWSSTQRRKNCLISYYKYVKICEDNQIENYLKLASFYETSYKIKNLMKELISNLNYNFNELIHYLESCPLIKSINVNNKHWVLYHSEHSENEKHLQKNKQLVSRLEKSFETQNVNYIYGHTPIPKMINQFTYKKLEYNNCIKSQDYTGNKYYNIDVSHYGLCFFNLNTLEENYIGKQSIIETSYKSFIQNDYEIIDLTEYYQRNRKYVIKKNKYYYALVIYKHIEKLLIFYSFCNLFDNDQFKIVLSSPNRPNIQEALKLFISLDGNLEI